MGKKLILSASFLGATPLTIFALIFYLLSIVATTKGEFSLSARISHPKVEYQALPQERIPTVVMLAASDARVAVLKDFFKAYSSPLLLHAERIVAAADKYNLDYRILPAIAMQESTLCQKIPKNSYNCWGFGVYGGNVTRFKNYSEAIEIVSKTLAHEYKSKGYVRPEQIMAKYTPASNGSWAASVTYTMTKLQTSL